MKYFPIVLFVYNRVEHTKKVIESLLKNSLAKKSDLIIFSDGPKNNSESEKVALLREYINNLKGFKSINIFQSKENQGLGNSLINGITKVLKDNDAVIVLEDDIEVSNSFLNYMNHSLNFYKESKNVFHVSAYMYPINNNKIKDEFFFLQTTTCWGWGTWKDRWSYFMKDISYYIKIFENKKLKKKFNLNNSYNFYDQLILNKKGIINTWAVFWYASVFLNKGLCLHPKVSFSQNIGTDGSGFNTIDSNYFFIENLNETKKLNFITKYEIDETANNALVNYFKLLKYKRLSNYVRVNGLLNTTKMILKYIIRNYT